MHHVVNGAGVGGVNRSYLFLDSIERESSLRTEGPALVDELVAEDGHTALGPGTE